MQIDLNNFLTKHNNVDYKSMLEYVNKKQYLISEAAEGLFNDKGGEALIEVGTLYNQTHRHYHNYKHLVHLLYLIFKLDEESEVEQEIIYTLIYIAFFHDAYYIPWEFSNEENSANLFNKYCDEYPANNESVAKLIHTAIIDTKNHICNSEISKLFSQFDMAIISHGSVESLFEYEKGIFKEFQFADWNLYKSMRLSILQDFFNQNSRVELGTLIEYVKNFKPKIGFYPGSFNPFHKGHANILHKAERMFDKVIIGRGINFDKKIEMSDTDLREVLPNQIIVYTDKYINEIIDGLTKQGQDITLIRGLRNSIDFANEMMQIEYLNDLSVAKEIPICNVVFIPCDREYAHFSSSAIRKMNEFQSGSGDYIKFTKDA